ncbi:hypothetical protein VP1G_03367 [Cytospora mali]|uniref:IBR domain-containing protein n=1 Tax=Cytospora mali TaxID=578113 RepID=A0A194UWF9_CYTMA|nr:hypothetical protein VP1G_03367 [Valsa mali var. pyri (nom. inval.)]
MGSLAIQLPIANNAADAMNVHPLDELNDAAFVVEVLRSGHTEEQLEEELITKATALGISIPRPPSPAEKIDCSGADSDATLSPSHVRNSSSGSGETAVAAITSNQSSRPNTSAEAQGPTYPIPSPRARSRSLNFSTTLVELTQGCTHMTCRCKAQFCYICGAIWDQDVGCPNFCNGEEELERRRMEEAAREAELEAEKAAQEAAAAKAEVERQEAEKRTQASEEFMKLKEEQEEEMMRFRTYERKSKWIMWKRHAERKLVLNEKYSDLIEKMKDRHAKTEQHLEERQIAAEMELRASLEQAEKSVRIRVKHMEAYCKALGRSSMSGDSNMPPRVVTERHLRELGQQHNVLEGMARLHQARINVLRDRQAKRMEELLERQEKELEKLEEKRDEDVEDMASEFANEEDALTKVFEERKARLVRRWELAIEILRVEMEKEKGMKYGPMPTPTWRAESPISIEELALADGTLAVVPEEEEKEEVE